MFKKLTALILIGTSSLFGAPLNAAETYDNGTMLLGNKEIVSYDSRQLIGEQKVKGDWYGGNMSSQGKVSVGTKNNENSNEEFLFRMKDSSQNGLTIYQEKDHSLSSGATFDSGRHNAWMGNSIEYQVLAYDNNVYHTPWGWTGI